MTKVMVVTPVYSTPENNRLDLLLQNIYWVQQQRASKMHVIVDDGSTDQTAEVVSKIARNRDDLILVQKENGGSSSAVNHGVASALGCNPDFITIHHSDDVMLPGSLERRVQSATGKDVVFQYTDQLVFFEDGTPTRYVHAEKMTDSTQLFAWLLAHKPRITYQTFLWKTQFYLDDGGGYDTGITSAEDWDIALQTSQALRDQPFEVLALPTVAYRNHADNLGPVNLRDGTKWKCYKMILAKHLKGKDYTYALIKESVGLGRMLLPEKAKVPMRTLRDAILSRPPVFLPYRSEFLEQLHQIDYKKALGI